MKFYYCDKCDHGLDETQLRGDNCWQCGEKPELTADHDLLKVVEFSSCNSNEIQQALNELLSGRTDFSQITNSYVRSLCVLVHSMGVTQEQLKVVQKAALAFPQYE